MSEVPLHRGYLKPRSLNTLRVVLSGWELTSMHSILWARSLDRARHWRMSRFIRKGEVLAYVGRIHNLKDLKDLDGSLSLAREPVRKVQGYLAHTKQPLPRTLQ